MAWGPVVSRRTVLYHLLRGKARFHVLPGDRHVVGVFHAYAKIPWIKGSIAIYNASPMQMAVDIAIEIADTIRMDWNMAKGEVIELPVGSNVPKVLSKLLFPWPVVVSSNKNLIAIKAIKDIKANPRHGDIAQVVHFINWPNDGVPSFNHYLVSLVRGTERAKRQAIGSPKWLLVHCRVTKVRVGDQEDVFCHE